VRQNHTAANYEKYANFENRLRIVTHYVLTHPATVQLQLGLFRFVRDINPIHFALERGWQIGSGKEMFTEKKFRLGAAAEFFLSLSLSYGISKVLRSLRYAPKTPTGAKGTITDEAYFAQRTYKNAFSNEPGAAFKGMTVDQVADALQAKIIDPRMVPVDYINREGKMLILNTRSAQALTQAKIPRSEWIGVNRTSNPHFEARLSGQLKRNKLTSSGTPTVKPRVLNNENTYEFSFSLV
jgi:hypothetical protein